MKELSASEEVKGDPGHQRRNRMRLKDRQSQNGDGATESQIRILGRIIHVVQQSSRA